MDIRDRLIERLGAWFEQVGKKKAATYKSHYATILNWDRRDQGENKGQFKTRTRATLDAIDDLERLSGPPQKQIAKASDG